MKQANLFVTVILIGMLVIVGGASAVQQITISNVTMTTGSTGTATITLDSAPTGLAGYKLNLSLSDPSVADNITLVTYPTTGFNQFATLGSTWSSAIYTSSVNTLTYGGFQSGYIKAADTSGSNFGDGSTNILLATVTIHGLKPGSTALHGSLDTVGAMTDNYGGSYVSTTTVTDGTITVTPVTPVASFTGTPVTGDAPLAVTFTDTSSNFPTAWAWDFGDGATATTQNATHTYTTSGTYTVNLTATNAAGSNTVTQTGYITVTGAAVPVASFTTSGTSGCVPYFIRLTDTSTNTPTSWIWNFGDGSTSTAQSPTHTYMATGTYTVSLTATNGGGSSTPVTTTITVNAATETGVGLANSAWPKFQHDISNSGLSPFIGSQSGTPKWSVTPYSKESGRFPPMVNPVIGTDGTVYAATSGGRLYAIIPGTTTATYNKTGVFSSGYYQPSGYQARHAVAIGSNGVMYFGGQLGYIYAIDTSTNTLKWTSPQLPIDGGAYVYFWGAPTIGSDGTIYVGSAVTTALNPTDGSIKWQYPVPYKGAPAIGSDGTIYVSFYGNNTVVAINPNGTLKWSASSGGSGSIRASVALGPDGTLYGVSSDNNLTAWNPDGTLKWSNATAGNIGGTPAIGPDGTIYVSSYQDAGYGDTGATPTIGADGTIYAPNVNTVYAWNPDGTLKWTWTTGSSLYYTSAITPDGQTKWTSSDTSGYYSNSVAIDSDGTTYIANYNKKVYAYPGNVALTANTTTGNDPLTVQFTGTSQLEGNTWHWDFGDGTNSTEQNPLHVYTTPGSYSVNLSITNSSGSNCLVKTSYITVTKSPPLASFTATPTSGFTPLAVQFNDTSLNTPTAWDWNFGDGSANSTFQNGTHTYSNAGTYTVTLTATNAGGSSTVTRVDLITVTVPLAPVAAFSAEVVSGAVPLTVNFTDLSTNVPTSWLWDFGDGTNATGQNVSHTYTTVGSYSVNLTVTNIGGSNSTLKAHYITASIAPVAGFTASPTTGTAPLTATFTDTSSNTPTSWAWDFGDGSTATTENATHTYTAFGTYTVNLTVTNAAGSNTTTKTGYISVSENPADRAWMILPAASLYQNNATQLPVQVMNITNGTGISFDLAYDPAVIRVDEITLNQSYESGSNLAVNATPGMIRLSFTRTDGINISAPVPVFFVNTTG
ncbi:MAG: PKD domain-containing protein, partial [Methanoregula sp.]